VALISFGEWIDRHGMPGATSRPPGDPASVCSDPMASAGPPGGVAAARREPVRPSRKARIRVWFLRVCARLAPLRLIK